MTTSYIIRDPTTSNFSNDALPEQQGVQAAIHGINKNTVLLECRMFNETPLNALKCYDTLTKVLQLFLTKGEALTQTEESNLFFSITKLFQSNNDKLRRMLYLAIKTLKLAEGEAFIVTSSLTKDMNSEIDPRRANAIRVLSKIVDVSMATQIDRFLKAAIVDKSAFVASASLVCALKLFRICPDFIKRWGSEITESIRSKNKTVQYHALNLLYEIKKNDRLALRKLIGNLLVNPIQGPFATCSFIRYATNVLESENDEAFEIGVFNFLEISLRSNSEAIVLEAAQAYCTLVTKNSSLDLSSTLAALCMFLGSNTPVVRFGSIRVLNQLSKTHPQLVQPCYPEVETLLSDSNKHIALLALMTLLRISGESSIERLVKRISTLMSDVGDNFRSHIIKAVRQLALTYPAKHKVLLAFLAEEIQEEASFEVKKDLIETIGSLMHDSPQALESGLLYLCEYIEDCEYPLLLCQVLTMLGDNVHKTSCPSRYIRYIYNRLILETPSVRASAIHALANIAMLCPSLKEDIHTLLESCLTNDMDSDNDGDDEIRERMLLYFETISNSLHPTFPNQVTLEDVLKPKVSVPLDALLNYTETYLKTNSSNVDSGPLDMTQVCQPIDQSDTLCHISTTSAQTDSDKKQKSSPEDEPVSVEDTLIQIIFSLASDVTPGSYDHRTKNVFITEEEAEYSVQCRKHIFQSKYMVLEFIVTNTMSNQHLKNLDITIATCDSSCWKILGTKPIKVLPPSDTDSLYVLLQLESFIQIENNYVPTLQENFTSSLGFDIEDPDTLMTYSDTYNLELFHISVGDYFIPKVLTKDIFKEHWTLLNDSNESSANFMLNYRNIQIAVTNILANFSLAPIDNSLSQLEGASSYKLLCSGVFTGGAIFLARCSFLYTDDHGCILKITCRTKLRDLCTTVFNTF